MIKNILITLRPRQWIKNLFVFAALIFTRNLTNLSLLEQAILAFVIFCGLSASVYIINDILDLEQDRQHPLKRQRPIASGRLGVPLALLLSLVLAVISLLGALPLDGRLFLTALIYFGLNLIYSWKLKHVVIVDVLIVAIGFVLRAMAGAYAIDVPISNWLYLCTILISLFLALAKRRHELVLLEDKAINHRASLGEYSPYFLDQLIAVVAPSTLVAYALYTMDPEVTRKLSPNLIFTVPFVIYGIFRYLYLVHQKDKGGSPTEIMLTDIPLMLNIVLWLLIVLWVIH